jgi:hypothetical protein
VAGDHSGEYTRNLQGEQRLKLRKGDQRDELVSNIIGVQTPIELLNAKNQGGEKEMVQNLKICTIMQFIVNK